jgi:hypothetical protein
VEKGGLNLPAPFNITENDVDYVCNVIEDILSDAN